MGNRGTTPSWDDEQIAKYGIMMHLQDAARRNQRQEEYSRIRRERECLEFFMAQVIARSEGP